MGEVWERERGRIFSPSLSILLTHSIYVEHGTHLCVHVWVLMPQKHTLTHSRERERKFFLLHAIWASLKSLLGVSVCVWVRRRKKDKRITREKGWGWRTRTQANDNEFKNVNERKKERQNGRRKKIAIFFSLYLALGSLKDIKRAIVFGWAGSTRKGGVVACSLAQESIKMSWRCVIILSLFLLRLGLSPSQRQRGLPVSIWVSTKSIQFNLHTIIKSWKESRPRDSNQLQERIDSSLASSQFVVVYFFLHITIIIPCV